MLRFQHIWHLAALGIVPVLVLLFVAVLLWRRRKLRQLGDARLVQSQLRGLLPGRSTTKFILPLLALAAVIIGWANLQRGDKADTTQRKGVDVVIALDVSKSMLARDIEPDRLTRAKQLIARTLDKLESDRVALVIFAGRAYLQVPLTVDYSAAKMMLQNITPADVPTQGTVIGDAVDMAELSFSQKEKKYKTLIIISDGEDHDEQALEKVQQAAKNGVIVHTVGIGSPQGTTIYDPATNSLKLDEKGSPVISKLNEGALKALAVAGNGTYTMLRNTDDAAEGLADAIGNMEQQSAESVTFTHYISYFQYFLLAGLFLLIIDAVLPGARKTIKKLKTT